MANFDLSIALKLDELREVRIQKITDFLNVVQCYHDMLTEEGKFSPIKFIVAAKIKEEPKTRLGSTQIETFEQLKTALLTKVVAQESSEMLQKKLTTLRQNKMTLTEYAKQLMDLANRLTIAIKREQQLQDDGNIAKMGAKLALNQFKSGCHSEVQNIVIASNPKALEDAVQIAISSNLDNQPSSSIYTIRKHFDRRQGNFKKQQYGQKQQYNQSQQYGQQQQQQYGQRQQYNYQQQYGQQKSNQQQQQYGQRQQSNGQRFKPKQQRQQGHNVHVLEQEEQQNQGNQ